MTYEQFVEKAKAALLPKKLDRIGYDSRGWADRWSADKNDDRPYGLIVEWSTGGVSGGSCWDDSDPQPYDGDAEPDFKTLETVVAAFAPKIAYFEYKALYAEIVVRSDREDDEWYGNETRYGVKTVELRNLYDALVKRGLIEGA